MILIKTKSATQDIKEAAAAIFALYVFLLLVGVLSYFMVYPLVTVIRVSRGLKKIPFQVPMYYIDLITTVEYQNYAQILEKAKAFVFKSISKDLPGISQQLIHKSIVLATENNY